MNVSELIDKDTFCISDTHFGHKKVIEFEPVRKDIASKSGFSDHEECLISKINETTGKDGVLLLIGDFAFKAIEHYSKLIAAKDKVIILGNHDRKAPLYRQYGWMVFDGIYHQVMDSYPFVYSNDELSLVSGLIKEIDGVMIMFSHYPVFNDDEYDRENIRIEKRSAIFEDLYTGLSCDLNIHGHVHSKATSFSRCVNVSCEPLEFTPVTIGQIIECNMGIDLKVNQDESVLNI